MSETKHGPSGRSLLATWLALMALAGTSFALHFAHLGGWSVPVALGIAAAKALLVALVFMELAFETATVRFAFVAGVALLAIMITLMVADVLTRTIPPLETPAGTEPRDRG